MYVLKPTLYSHFFFSYATSPGPCVVPDVAGLPEGFGVIINVDNTRPDGGIVPFSVIGVTPGAPTEPGMFELVLDKAIAVLVRDKGGLNNKAAVDMRRFDGSLIYLVLHLIRTFAYPPDISPRVPRPRTSSA